MSSTTKFQYQAGRDVRIYQSQTSYLGRNDVPKISKKEKAAGRLRFLEGKLMPHIIKNVSYTGQGKRPCDPDTRKAVLDDIKLWSEDTSEESRCFYWLSGDPGVGKSAITSSIAEFCRTRNILGAQFFINRNDKPTTDPLNLFSTICWQLCNYSPEAAIAMEKTLRPQDTLSDDLLDQAQQLFVGAIKAATKTNQNRATVVVIDALDETDAERLRSLAQIFSEALVDLPLNAKVFISSRGYNSISNAFYPLSRCRRVKCKFLKTKESIEEVAQFMKKKIKKILDDNDLSWDQLGDVRMQKLSFEASGLFIWAETALRFIQAEIEHVGAACLERFDQLMHTLTTDGMGDLNQLYLTILQNTCDGQKKRTWQLHRDDGGDDDDGWVYRRFHRIIGAILVCQTPLSIADIGQLLDLKERDYSAPVDLLHFVRQYRIVLVDNTKKIDEFIVPRMHKSFVDFITSESAKKFRVNESVSHGEIALQCIGRLEDLLAYLKQETPSCPKQLVYASQHWKSHLTRMVGPGLADKTDEVEEKNENEDKFKGNDIQHLPAKFVGPEQSFEGQTEELLSFAFSPNGTQFASSYAGGAIHIWDARTGLKTTSLNGHKKDANCIVFSPDGTQLVSVSDDKTARMWDTRMWKELYVLRGHTYQVYYAAFSNDGGRVVTCSEDIRSWDTQTGQQLRISLNHGIQNPVLYSAFSPNDQRIVSLALDGSIRVWDVSSGNLISQMTTYDGIPKAIVFCPDGTGIMSHELPDKSIMLWDAESGDMLNDIANFMDAPLAFVKDLEQRSGNSYISIPQALKRTDLSSPCVYTLSTLYGTVCGVVEHGQGAWEFFGSKRKKSKLHFSAGATRMDLNDWQAKIQKTVESKSTVNIEEKSIGTEAPRPPRLTRRISQSFAFPSRVVW